MHYEAQGRGELTLTLAKKLAADSTIAQRIHINHFVDESER
jgi:hypothetical protein